MVTSNLHIRHEITEKAEEALNRIMLFNSDRTKKDVLSGIILDAVKQYKGKKPPKAKKCSS